MTGPNTLPDTHPTLAQYWPNIGTDTNLNTGPDIGRAGGPDTGAGTGY
ncbi:MAG: hypothetical protein ABF791_12535 [Acetobacter sp.]